MFKVNELVIDIDKPNLIGIITQIKTSNDSLYPVCVNFFDSIDDIHTGKILVTSDTYTLDGKRLNDYPNSQLKHFDAQNNFKEQTKFNENTITVQKVSDYGVVITLENGFSFYRDKTGTLLEIKSDRIKI